MTTLDDLTCGGCGLLPVDHLCGCTDPAGGTDPALATFVTADTWRACRVDPQVQTVRVSWDPDPWRHPIQRLRTWRIRRRIRASEAESQRRRESSDPVERIGQKLSDAVSRELADAFVNGGRRP